MVAEYRVLVAMVTSSGGSDYDDTEFGDCGTKFDGGCWGYHFFAWR